MSYDRLFLVVCGLSSMLISAEPSPELPAQAAESIRAMDTTLAQIAMQQRRRLAMVRNASLIELDAVLTTAESCGDIHSAGAVRRSMQAIIDKLLQDSDRESIDASTEVASGSPIIGMWALVGSTATAYCFVEVLDGGACNLLPMTACVGHRRIACERQSFNRSPTAP